MKEQHDTVMYDITNHTQWDDDIIQVLVSDTFSVFFKTSLRDACLSSKWHDDQNVGVWLLIILRN